MIATVVISLITFILIVISLLAFPRFKVKQITIHTYWIIALLGALILISFSLVPLKEAFVELTNDSSINPLKILVLFFSMALISILLDEFGLFSYLASLAIRSAKNQKILFFSFYFLVATLTIFTSNDVVILTFTPFICFFLHRLKVNPVPYLVAEFAAANTYSLLFIIGNPTNIFLATSANISFIDYFKVMALPTLAAGAIELLLLYLIFRKKLNEPLTKVSSEVIHIKNKLLLIVGVSHLGLCLIFLVISNYINLQMWLISLICASSLLIFSLLITLIQRKDTRVVINASKRLPYELIPFFLSMFVIVVALNYQGVSFEIAKLLGTKGTIFTYGYSSFLMCNVINNIPMSILYTGLCGTLESSIYLSSIYASIIGSNIGAFLTPIGALAGIMFISLLNTHEVKFTFLEFIKYGVVISIPTISGALIVLYLIYSF